MRIRVQKFGGTSVATEEGRRRVADRLLEASRAGFAPVAVISAMGRHPAPYATDTLLSLVASWRAVEDPRELDMLMACGETLSCVVMAHFLRSLGVDARAFTGPGAGILTDAGHGEARIVAIHPQAVLDCLSAGGVPVVAGFQGCTPAGEVTTLGRGGSDTTAVALGAALGAEAVDIFTDVDGVMTADPRLVEEARVLASVGFQEMGEMANQGAKVLHPRAVELAEGHGVPVVVRSTFTGAPGTEISDRPVAVGRIATGVVTVAGMSRVRVDLESCPDLSSARTEVFSAMAEAGLSLDLINLVGPRLYFICLTSEFEPRGRRLLDSMGHPYEALGDCAKVAVVGSGMRGVPGVMLRIHRALAREGIEVLHSTDSHITISCLVPEADLRRAAAALHGEFGLG